jgi:O-antigen ligase
VVRWHVGPLPTTLLENLVLITCALYLVLLALQRGRLPWLTRYEVPIALFLLAGLVEVFVAPDHRGALGIFRAYLVEPVAIFYVAIAVLDTTAAIELVLAVAAVGAAVFGIIELGTFLRALVNGGLLPGHAAAAFDINPNGVALYLEPLIGVAIGFLLFGQGRHRWVAAASLVILLPAEVATLSRGGLLSLAALAFIAILTVRQVRFRIGLVIATIAAVIIVLVLPLTRFRLSHALDPISGTFAGRERLWIATLRMLHDHPMFGAGLNAYQIVMAPYRLVDSNLGPEQYPHNLLLTSWTELGLLGMFALFYILINLIVQPWRALSRAAGVYRPLLWGTGAAFSMMLVHGLVDSPFWKNDLSLEFWLLAALQVVALRAVGSARPKANQKSAP